MVTCKLIYRAGASYLMACDLTDPNRPDSPVFVAQV